MNVGRGHDVDVINVRFLYWITAVVAKGEFARDVPSVLGSITLSKLVFREGKVGNPAEQSLCWSCPERTDRYRERNGGQVFRLRAIFRYGTAWPPGHEDCSGVGNSV